jgi:NADPH-dependent glutamate synthase beta subunit-like oxidoreductase
MASTAAGGIKVAIIGSGPSGFYCAARLLAAQNSLNVKVHMYERLPTPHGLVRYGVAPDHPEVKVSSVQSRNNQGEVEADLEI